MQLFRSDPDANMLPCNGEAYDHGPLFGVVECDRILRLLMNGIPWRHDESVMFGKRIVTARKVAWFADGGISYSYSGTVKPAHEWMNLLLELKGLVEALTGAEYNSCLLNLYHHGGEGMGWHSDDENSIAADSSIASLSFGAERKFSFRHKVSKETVSTILRNGGLLDMRGDTQRHWQHQLPKTKKVSEPRVNLTFRRMG
jgi:alkylated DNA repair dioxygenase AlkB